MNIPVPRTLKMLRIWNNMLKAGAVFWLAICRVWKPPLLHYPGILLFIFEFSKRISTYDIVTESYFPTHLVVMTIKEPGENMIYPPPLTSLLLIEQAVHVSTVLEVLLRTYATSDQPVASDFHSPAAVGLLQQASHIRIHATHGGETPLPPQFCLEYRVKLCIIGRNCTCFCCL